MKVKLNIVKNLPEIIKQSVKPIENIEGIKIVDVNGLGINSDKNSNNIVNDQGQLVGGQTGGNDIVDRVVTGALKYRTQAPILDELVREVGLTNEGEKLSDVVLGKSSLLTGKINKNDKLSSKKTPNKT